MKNIQEVDFKNADDESLIIGHIYYQSSKWLLYSFITSAGIFDGFTLQRILSADKLKTVNSSDYLNTIKKYAKNAKFLNFYDPFGQENLLTDFELSNLTDENICQKFLSFIKEKEVFAKVLLFGNTVNEELDFGNYTEGQILEITDESFTTWDIDTDIVKFDEKYDGQYEDIYIINIATPTLNQMQAVMKQESEDKSNDGK
ncbi:hypothetical protein [Lactococcus cremoris]|uniref:hypothetical protein n=1 Tax=Lactococcus lactis subsp. cremoris TaxID=1359 RepID=UPI0003AB9E65|nr:hypothetical protein [Lactococcus cremoris]AGV72433.1 hypothetical protein kw2_0452 [Lactococcus cremoris subsp. cremoris KW2]